MTIVTLGIDLGKNVCSLAGLDAEGRVVMLKRLKRDGVVPLVASLTPCLVMMEAGFGVHYLGRRLVELGWLRGSADLATIRAALRQFIEERRPERRGDC